MEPVIAVYGATGALGPLVAAEALRRGVDVVLAGPDGAALEELADRLDEPARVRTQVARVADEGRLRTLAESADALVHCAEPYAVTGEPVALAAAEAGCHYVDHAMRPHHVLRMFERLAEPARRAGIIMIPEMGFFCGLADLLAAAVTERMTRVDRVTTGYWLSGQELAADVGETDRVTFTDGAVWLGDVEIREAVYPFPMPVGPRVVLAPFQTGEVVTIPRHVPARKVEAQAGFAEDQEGPPGFVVSVQAIGPVGGGRNAFVRGRDINCVGALASVEAAVRLIQGEGPQNPGVYSPAQAFPAIPFLLVMEHLGAFTFALRVT
jgi:saccharopine dehydrogenase-like protein